MIELVAPTLAAAVTAAARKHPQNGFTFQAMDGSERRCLWGDIERDTARRCAGLQAQGIGKGDRVGLILIEPEEFVVSFLAIVRIGAVPVPLYPPMALGELDAYLDRLANILSTSSSRLLLASQKLHKLLWGVVDRVKSLERVMGPKGLDLDGVEPVYPEITPDDLAFLQYTSGSTSDPKGVMVTHRNLHANCTAMVNHLGLEPENTRSLAWLPLYHDMGLIGFVITTVFNGHDAVLVPTLRFLKRPNVWMDAVHRHRATITFCPPFALGLAVRRAREKHLAEWDLSCLHSVGVGAEPINPEGARTFEAFFQEHCGLREGVVLPAYGMAESTLCISMKRRGAPLVTRWVHADSFDATGQVNEPVEGEAASEHVSCGDLVLGLEARIWSEEAGWLDDGQQGEICLSGSSITPGYFENAEATASSWRDGWLHTGDLGYVIDDQVYVTGRVKDLIILKGRNLHPQSLEWLIAERVDGVRRGNVVCFSRPGADTEELVVAVERKPDAPETLEEDLRALLRRTEGLSVSDVVVLERGQLPKTSSGKLQRRKTRQLYLDGMLGSEGVRTQGAGGSRLIIAKHIARSAWTRAKVQVRG